MELFEWIWYLSSIVVLLLCAEPSKSLSKIITYFAIDFSQSSYAGSPNKNFEGIQRKTSRYLVDRPWDYIN